MKSLREKKRLFSKIYNKNIDSVYRFVFLKVSSEQIGQDICSEAFLRFWKSLEAGVDIQNPRAFIYQITRNLVVDHYREKGKQREHLTSFPVEGVQVNNVQVNPEKEAILASDLGQMQKALSEIKDDYQDVIIWYYLDGITIREIAQMTGKTENNIRVMVHRALEALRQVISD